MIGLNFADESEANSFNTAINERLATKQRKKEGEANIFILLYDT